MQIHQKATNSTHRQTQFAQNKLKFEKNAKIYEKSMKNP